MLVIVQSIVYEWNDNNSSECPCHYDIVYEFYDPLQVARAIEERQVTVAGLVSKPWPVSGFRIAFSRKFLRVGMVLDAYVFKPHMIFCIDLYT